MNSLKKKKIPCENCRDQKRKCNGFQPCERCEKLNIACVYIQQLSPIDEEYMQLIRNSILEKEVSTLESQLKEMESEIANIKEHKINSVVSQQQHQVDQLLTIYNNNNNNNNNNNKPLVWRLEMTKGQLYFQTNIKTLGEFFDHLQNLNQVIHFNNNIPSPLERHTFKTSLMRALNQSIQRKYNKVRYKTALLAIEYQDWKHDHCSIDFTLSSSTSPSSSPISTSISTSHLHDTKDTTLFINDNNILFNSTLSPPLSTLSSSSSKNIFLPPSLNTTLSLVKKYTECQHLYQFAIHIPTFYRYFENINSTTTSTTSQSMNDDLSISPALTSFCAVLCTLDCDHILQLVPEHHLHFYGHYYFEHAKRTVAERFDEVSLELLTTYVFMSVYKWNTYFEKESTFYADMAHRLSLLLANDYDRKHEHQQHCHGGMDDQDDTIHFHRIISYLTHTCVYQQTSTANVERACRNRDLQQLIHRFSDISRSSSLPNHHHYQNKKRKIDQEFSPIYFITMQKETPFLQYHAYRHELQLMVKEVSQNYIQHCNNLQEMMVHLSYQIESKIVEWYQGLEVGYQLIHLPLFDSATTLSDQVYFQLLAKECGDLSLYQPQPQSPSHQTVIPALTTLAVYDEFLLLGLAALPKREYTKEEWNIGQTLHQFWDGGKEINVTIAEQLGLNIEKWQRRFDKLNQLRKEVSGCDDGYNSEKVMTDEVFLDLMTDLLYSNSQRYRYPFLYHVFQATLNTIRISQYLLYRRWKGLCCYFDKRLLMNAEAVLTRFLIGGAYLDPSIQQYVPLIQEKVILCKKLLQVDFSNSASMTIMEEDLFPF
ncbi:unnamed protein product [Cunninghamella echinulata]